MQSNHYLITIKKVYPKVFQVLKYPVAAACAWYIYSKLSGLSFDLQSLDLKGLTWLFVSVFALMLVNWLIEARRWQISITFESITFTEALRAVLAGLSLNWVFPFTLGDLGGRLAGRQSKKESLFAIGVNRMIILSITLLYGGLSLIFFLGSGYWWLIVMVFLVLFILIFLITKTNILGKSAEFISPSLLLYLSAITIFRYAIFTFQFYLLLRFFNSDLASLIIVMGIGWVFLFRTIVPSILGSIGVREASAIVFFEPYVAEVQLVLIPCLLIWLINTVVPSLTGILFILGYSHEQSIE